VKTCTPTFLLFLLVIFCADSRPTAPTPPESINELRQRLEQTLRDTRTPGMAVAIVHRDGLEWAAALGLADLAADRAATPETLFRIGSVSKSFAALSILILVNEGKLSLDDQVSKLAPEIWSENRWEATDPVRVVHLLEHTTGWDDIHPREYAKDAPATMSLRDQLDYDHHSRISRWRPGTRMSYCNSGSPVAAYIVEKITGERFEDFVQKRLFEPIGMKTATYFQPSPELIATLYHDDGKTPFEYWNILLRPAGSINASANDMANYLRFYLNRGKVNNVEIVPVASIDRMENPASTWAAKEGLKAGYGLGNAWLPMDGFVYHGHDGGVIGGLTEMWYLPDQDVGYFFSINSGSDDAVERIGASIRAYITRKLQKQSLPAVASLSANAAEYAGFYQPDSPRVQMLYFAERLLGLSHFHFENAKLVRTDFGGRTEFLPVTGTQFRSIKNTRAPEPIPSVTLIKPNDEGRFIQLAILETGTDPSVGETLKRLPTWLAVVEIATTAYFFLAVVSIAIYALFWIPAALLKRPRRPAELAMLIWPSIAVLSLICIGAIFQAVSADPVPKLGNPTVWSIGVFLASIVFAGASVASVIGLWRAPEVGIRSSVRSYSMAVAIALLIATTYLAYWGFIGVRTWA